MSFDLIEAIIAKLIENTLFFRYKISGILIELFNIMLPKFLDKSKIPHKPGIYIYKNNEGQVIYVGKAIDLFSRVSSYFRRKELVHFNGQSASVKTAHLVANITSIETIIVESELEALILEANLIKKYLPLYNVRLTDDKDYLYIAITKEEFPQVITARKKDLPALSALQAGVRHGLKPIREWFGPFPSAKTTKNTLKQLRRVFPWCSNPSGSRNKYNRACFYYHIRLCPGACVGQISKEEYNKIIKRFSKFLRGEKEELLKELEKEMEQLSKSQQFEEAAKTKRVIGGINYLTQTNRVVNYLENPNYLEEETQKSLEKLQKDLNLPNLPERIEAYDISNIQGKEATGSLVVLTNGEIDKSQYRRFKIRLPGKANDYAMHAEMMGRRLNHPEWPYPQLFLIDGGRGQVRASWEVIKKHTNDIRNIPIYGLAKRMEWLYPPDGEVVKLPKRSLSLRLLQKIRDESHRFAIAYHRKLRKKAFGI